MPPPVQLSLPADPAWIDVGRTVVATTLAVMGVGDSEAAEDLQTALAETLLDLALAPGVERVDLAVGEDAVEVWASGHGVAYEPSAIEGLVRRLAAVEVSQVDGGVSVRLARLSRA